MSEPDTEPVYRAACTPALSTGVTKVPGSSKAPASRRKLSSTMPVAPHLKRALAPVAVTTSSALRPPQRPGGTASAESLQAVSATTAATACSDSADAVPPGRWGGRNAELVVTASGASARFKCGATGVVEESLRIEAGSFDEPGTFVTPVLNAGVQPARYMGSVSGSDMTLALSVSGQAAGTFQLHLGADPAFDVCNF